jgi:hypothetical protein
MNNRECKQEYVDDWIFLNNRGRKNKSKREISEMGFFMDRMNFDDYFDDPCVMEMLKCVNIIFRNK